MKKMIKKVRFALILWIFLIVALIINRIYAESGNDLTLSLSTDKTIYSAQENVEVKVKLNKKIMTASFYLNYDSTSLEFIKTKTSSTAVKDYPNDNLIRVVYADISGNGTTEINFEFKLKENKSNIKLSLSNLTMDTTESKKSYTQDKIIGAYENIKINPDEKSNTQENKDNNISKNTDNNLNNNYDSINNDTGSISNSTSNNGKTNNTINQTKQIEITKSKNTPKTTSTGAIAETEMPKTGVNDMLSNLLLALFIIITIYLGYNAIKLEKYFKS